MNKKVFMLLAIATFILTTIARINLPHSPVQAQTHIQFICAEGYDVETNQHHPTTYAWTPRGKTAIIRWTRDGKLGFKNYPPQRRCEEVSPRFHQAYHQDILNMMTNGTLNNEPVICAVKEYGEACTSDNLLITLKPEDDSLNIINDLKDMFNGEQVGPIRHNSKPQIYVGFDIDKFLRTAPVE